MNNTNTTKEIRLADLQVKLTTVSAKNNALKLNLSNLQSKLGDELPKYIEMSYKIAIDETDAEYKKLDSEYKLVEAQ